MNAMQKTDERWVEVETLLTQMWEEAVEAGTESEFSGKLMLLLKKHQEHSSLATMFASEDVLRRDWDSEEEDGAWAHL